MFVLCSSLPADLKLLTGVMMQRTGESECYSTSIPGSLSVAERAGDEAWCYLTDSKHLKECYVLSYCIIEI